MAALPRAARPASGASPGWSQWPRAILWILRVTWVMIPLAGAAAMDRATDDLEARPVILGLAWVGFALGLGALAVPSVRSLTTIRMVAPAAVVLMTWIAARDGVTLSAAVGAALAASAAVLALSAPLGHAMVDASSYGRERRFLLRPPAALFLGPIPLAWALGIAGVVTGPILLGADRPRLGALALALGLPISALMVRALHRLSRRWLVFVPGGVVLHDASTLSDPVFLESMAIAHVGPAARDHAAATNLTAGAPGLMIEIRLVRPLALPTRVAGSARVTTETHDAVLVIPSRPGAFLAHARSRGLLPP